MFRYIFCVTTKWVHNCVGRCTKIFECKKMSRSSSFVYDDVVEFPVNNFTQSTENLISLYVEENCYVSEVRYQITYYGNNM